MLIKAHYINKGFTLIELAIVLVVVGILAGSFITTLGSRIDVTRRAETMDEMEVIKQALYGYAMSTNPIHLPCPDCRNAACIKDAVNNFANDGIEDSVGPVCDVDVADAIAVELPIGNLPWQTLGLGYGDSWANRYGYWVSEDVSNSGGFLLGDLIEPATINTRAGTVVATLSNNAVAVIMSHGKNGYGAITMHNIANPTVPAANLDEVENTDDDLTFVARPQTEVGVSALVGEFDDILIWISEYELKAKMVEAGRLPL